MPNEPLPAHHPPLEDEPLSSYFEFVASDLGGTPGQLVAGLNPPLGKDVRRFDDNLSLDQIVALANLTHLTPDQVQRMTLQRYAGLGLQPSVTGAGYSGAWARPRGARYCPLHLQVRDLRWNLSHYLQWSFACVEHGVLLLQNCPSCGTGVRMKRRGHPRRAADTTSGRITCADRCATEVLAQAEAVELSDYPTLLRAQHQLDLVLADQRTVEAGTAVPAPVAMRDVAIVTRYALAAVKPSKAGERVRQLWREPEQFPAQLEDLLGELPSLSQPGRLAMAVREPLLGLFAAAVAVNALAQPDVASAAERLHWMTDTAWKTLPNSPRATAPSEVLVDIMYRGRGGIRKLSRTPRPRLSGDLPDNYRYTEARLPSSSVPGNFWPQALLDITERIELPRHVGVPGLLSLTLLGFRSRETWPALADELGLRYLSSLSDDDLRDRRRTLLNRRLLVELASLQHCLLEAPPPINYDRRRELFQRREAALGRNRLRRVAKAADAPLTRFFAASAQRTVSELLTGCDPYMAGAPGHLGAARLALLAWQRKLAPLAWDELRLIAEGMLLRHRLDEPLEWSPRLHGELWQSAPASDERRLPGWEGRKLREGPARLGARRPTLEALVAAAKVNERQLERLRRFAAVASTGSLGAASRVLNVHSSSLGDQMRRLEVAADVRLFHRATTGNRLGGPTPEGIALLELMARLDN